MITEDLIAQIDHKLDRALVLLSVGDTVRARAKIASARTLLHQDRVMPPGCFVASERHRAVRRVPLLMRQMSNEECERPGA